MKKSKTKIYITVIRCKATIIREIKLKEEQKSKFSVNFFLDY